MAHRFRHGGSLDDSLRCSPARICGPISGMLEAMQCLVCDLQIRGSKVHIVSCDGVSLDVTAPHNTCFKRLLSELTRQAILHRSAWPMEWEGRLAKT